MPQSAALVWHVGSPPSFFFWRSTPTGVMRPMSCISGWLWTGSMWHGAHKKSLRLCAHHHVHPLLYGVHTLVLVHTVHAGISQSIKQSINQSICKCRDFFCTTPENGQSAADLMMSLHQSNALVFDARSKGTSPLKLRRDSEMMHRRLHPSHDPEDRQNPCVMPLRVS